MDERFSLVGLPTYRPIVSDVNLREVRVMGSGGRTRAWIGLVLLIVGTLFLLDDLTTWHFPREALWSIVLIAVGVAN